MSHSSNAFGISFPKPGQPKSTNADYWATAAHHDDPKVELHIVCDGMSSAPNGRAAARTTCDYAIRHFRSNWKRSEAQEAFVRNLIVAANESVRAAYPEGGAKCTVVAALVIERECELVVGHAGDSPAFLLRDGVLKMLTRNHTEAQLQTQNGKPVLSAGAPVFVQAISRYIGQAGAFEPEVHVHRFELGDYLCLASDGVSGSSLGRFLAAASRRPSAKAITEFCQACSDESQDDSTLILHQLGQRSAVVNVEANFQEYANLSKSQRDELIHDAELLNNVDLELLFRCLESEDDEQRALRLLKPIEKSCDSIAKEKWITCLDGACEKNFKQLANQLVQLVRRL